MWQANKTRQDSIYTEKWMKLEEKMRIFQVYSRALGGSNGEVSNH